MLDITLVAFIREQLMWELTGIRHVVYTNGKGDAVSSLRLSKVRGLEGNSTGFQQLHWCAGHVMDAVRVFNPEATRDFLDSRKEDWLLSKDWLDTSKRILEESDLVSVAQSLDDDVTFTIGMHPYKRIVKCPVRGRLRWFTMPSITFHKMLVYNAMIVGGIHLSKAQAFGVSWPTDDGVINQQIAWRKKESRKQERTIGMKVAIIGIDSEIGLALSALHKDRGDQVVEFSRYPKNDATRWFDLSARESWSRPVGCDRIYYLVRGTTGNEDDDLVLGSLRSVRYLDWLSKGLDPCKIVVFSSTAGVPSSVGDTKNIPYRMMKAALNMGVRCLAVRNENTNVSWMLLHPGLVRTKATEHALDYGQFKGKVATTPSRSAKNIMLVSDSSAYKSGAFVDATNGMEIPL